ncbi:MAG: GNAT family protein [Chloroflexi bacterium]|nr:GNAT family protein [Chloroflexota bacterium]
MPHLTNEFGQPIGPPLPGWTPPARPARRTMQGAYCTVEPLDVGTHVPDLFEALSVVEPAWTYLPYGPFADVAAFREWARAACLGDDPLFYAIRDNDTGKAAGVASYLRITPGSGTIEVGHIHLGPALKGSRAGTEAMFLMMEYAFSLGYRRYEWKCDALNAPSRNAALRLGFTFEGTWRQGTVYKGRNRDTDWFSITDAEWPRLRKGFTRWLDPANFDEKGRQRRPLQDCARSGE